MAMLSDTIAEIIIRGRNETAVPFAEASAGLRAIQAEADRASVSMARAGGSVNGASKGIAAASVGTASALDAELAAVIKTADAHSLAADKEVAASQRVMLSTQGRSVTVARAFAVEREAATQTAFNLDTVYAKAVEKGAQEVLKFGAVTDATRVQIKDASVAMIRFAEATKIAGDSAGTASAKSAFLGREFLRIGDTANVAGAKVRVFDSMALGLTGNVTLLGAAIVGLSVKAFADFQQKMQQVGANTGLTREQIASLTQTILSMGTSTPVAVNDLAEGFRHIISEGYNLADSTNIAKAALMAATAEGANFGDVASTLATQMHNWGDGANKAAQDMGALMVGAQEGNLTLQDLAVNMNKIGVEMSSIHQPMGDAIALISELTRATGDPAIANTWAAGMVAHIIKPTKEAVTVMGELKQSTGIDLLAAFQAFSAGTINFSELMNQAKQATHGNAQEIMTLFGGLRGGLGALQLINGGLTQYDEIQAKTAAGAKELAKQAAAAQDTLEYKFNVGVNDAKIGLIEFGTVLNGTIDKLGKLKDGFNDLPGPVKALIVASTGAFAPIIAGVDLTKKGIDLLAGSTDHHTESIKKQLAALEKQKQALLDSKTADQGYRLGAENTATADEKLAEILKKEADLHQLAAANAEKHREALSKVANEMRDHLIPMESQLGMDLAGSKQPVYSPPTDDAIAAKISQANADVQIAANRLANDTLTHHTELLGRDRAALALALGVQQKWNNAIADGTAEVNKHDVALQKLDAELKGNLAAALALTTEGLKKEESAFTSMADRAISEATRMKTGVEAQVKAMNVAITKSVSWTPIIQPQTVQTTTATPTQFATSGPTYNPKGAETLDPALGKDMGQLSSALDNMPAKFQATADAWIQKFTDKETNLYDKYLISLNKENQRDADAINKINADYHAKVNEASIKANEREAAENTRYLNALDSIEQAYNDRLTQINNKFLTDYQTAIVTYETALETSRQKAEADAQKHEDQQRLLAANEQAALAGIHGKNAAARRQAVIEEYARRMAADDVNYGHTVSANEAHVAGLSKTFDNHIKSLAAWANNQIASAHTNLVSHEHNLAKIHAEALAGLDKWLKGRDTKAQADRERALLKEAGIHIVDINGILTAFDKGGKIVGQQILAALGKLPDILKASVFGSWAAPQGNHTFLGPGTPIGSMPPQSLGGGAFTAPSLTQIATDSKNLPYVDPNSARETTLSAALVEFQHQSVLLGQQRDLNADQIKIEQDKNRVDAGNAKLALDYLKYIALQSDPKATQADKTAQLQLIKGDVNANVENAGELASDIGKAVADAEQAVQAARNNVIAAESAIAVGLLQEQVTELSDLTGIMQAEANIQTALVNGQIAAINDQSAIVQDEYGIEVANGEIMKASGEITKATDANSRALALAHMVVAQAQLRVAEDHLQIDKTKAQADVVAAAWAVKIAEAEAHMAKDKLAVDKANALANNTVANAHLLVAQQQLKIAIDTAKLTQDIADSTKAQAVEMGATDLPNVAADKAALAADTAPLQGLMNNESDAQQQAQQIAAQGAYTLGQDQAGITGLQIGATSDSQNSALQLASLTAKQGVDSINLQKAEASLASIASTSQQQVTQLQTANNALIEQRDAYRDLASLMAQGVEWNGVGPNFRTLLDGLELQVHTSK